MKESLLYLDGVSVSRSGADILSDVTVSVQPGEITGVLGRNGAGKSSLAYAIMGLQGYLPIKGKIFYEGQDITGWTITQRAKAGLTLAWQHPARYEGIPVREYLELSSSEPSEDKLVEALNLVQLEGNYLTRMIDRNLSGGERKRIELASVYLMKPRLTILDEPDSGVDLLAMGDIIKLFRTMAGEGRSVLIITHRDDVAAECDRSYLICGGRIVLEGTSEAVRRYFMSQCRPCPELETETGYRKEEKVES